MERIRDQILKVVENRGFDFQRAYVIALRTVVLRRRQGCNEEQTIFWMTLASDAQQTEAFQDAVAIIDLGEQLSS